LPTLVFPKDLRRHHIVITHHVLSKSGNDINEWPNPVAVGLWADSAGRCTDGGTTQALFQVHLQKIKGSKQMLWAASLWEEVVPKDIRKRSKGNI
jgi:hypothetical protein